MRRRQSAPYKTEPEADVAWYKNPSKWQMHTFPWAESAILPATNSSIDNKDNVYLSQRNRTKGADKRAS
jgi:hypothetical protein